MKIILDILPREGPEKEYDPELINQIRELLDTPSSVVHYHIEVYPIPDAHLDSAIKEAKDVIEILSSANAIVMDLRDHMTRLKERL